MPIFRYIATFETISETIDTAYPRSPSYKTTAVSHTQYSRSESTASTVYAGGPDNQRRRPRHHPQLPGQHPPRLRQEGAQNLHRPSGGSLPRQAFLLGPRVFLSASRFASASNRLKRVSFDEAFVIMSRKISCAFLAQARWMLAGQLRI